MDAPRRRHKVLERSSWNLHGYLRTEKASRRLHEAFVEPPWSLGVPPWTKRTMTGEFHFSFQLTTSWIGDHTRLMFSLAKVITIHTNGLHIEAIGKNELGRYNAKQPTIIQWFRQYIHNFQYSTRSLAFYRGGRAGMD